MNGCIMLVLMLLEVVWMMYWLGFILLFDTESAFLTEFYPYACMATVIRIFMFTTLYVIDELHEKNVSVPNAIVLMPIGGILMDFQIAIDNVSNNIFASIAEGNALALSTIELITIGYVIFIDNKKILKK